MNSQALFTLLIPTYNQRALLEQTLASAQAQDYPNLEIVIVDNHSSDDTSLYLSTLQDSRIRIVTWPETIPPPYNAPPMLQEIRGQYVLILCETDPIESTLCSRAAAVFAQDPSVSLYVARGDFFQEEPSYPEKMPGKQFIQRYLIHPLRVASSGVVYRTVVLLETGGLPPLFSSDLQAMCRTALHHQVYLEGGALKPYRPSSLKAPLIDLIHCFRGIQALTPDDPELSFYFCYYIMFRSLGERPLWKSLALIPSFFRLNHFFKISRSSLLKCFIKALIKRLRAILTLSTGLRLQCPKGFESKRVIIPKNKTKLEMIEEAKTFD